MSNYKKIDKTIQKALDDGKQKFIIYPFGADGLLAKDILEKRYGLDDIIVIDNLLAEYRDGIYDSSFLDTLDVTNVAILFTSTNRILADKTREKHYTSAIYYVFNEFWFSNPRIGKCTYGELLLNDENKYESIGAFCSFAPGSCIVWNHPLHCVTTHAFMYSSNHASKLNQPKFLQSDFNPKSIIGNDVWLGRNVIVTNGSNIGNGVIAAAGAVITKDIPDYAVVAGVPAKIIRYRFSEEQIQKLNEIKWWDWPLETIAKRQDDFVNIDVFLEKYYDAGGG